MHVAAHRDASLIVHLFKNLTKLIYEQGVSALIKIRALCLTSVHKVGYKLC